MHYPRSSGILMPIFSLPDGCAVGDLGAGARRFIEFLKSAGQSIWQVLPLGPTAKGNSPYSSKSAFAGNPLLISCEDLVSSGLLTGPQLVDAGYFTLNQGHVQYDVAQQIRMPLLKLAFLKFCADGSRELRTAFAEFQEQNQSWLPEFARYDVLAEHLGDPDWSHWPPDLVQRQPSALQHADRTFADQIQLTKFIQFLFADQWQKLKQLANADGIRMYGDMPIFVAYESVDVWCHQDLFHLDGQGQLTVVAGVPPDYFSETGQMWGNPLYRWDVLAASRFEWWVERFRAAFQDFDILRIDHFRGFESYWEIPAGAENAIGGQWKPGPGAPLFDAVRTALGDPAIVAEDLGLITDAVHALREHLGFPGMRVLQFGCDSDEDPFHRPDQYPENSVVYTGTHDNDTVIGWYEHRRRSGANMDIVQRFLSGNPDTVHLDLISAVLNSRAHTAVIPLQDLLGLGSESRNNTPGLAAGNWQWRCSGAADFEKLASMMRTMTESTQRLPAAAA